VRSGDRAGGRHGTLLEIAHHPEQSRRHDSGIVVRGRA
jgi:hypothetical protein